MDTYQDCPWTTLGAASPLSRSLSSSSSLSSASMSFSTSTLSSSTMSRSSCASSVSSSTPTQSSSSAMSFSRVNTQRISKRKPARPVPAPSSLGYSDEAAESLALRKRYLILDVSAPPPPSCALRLLGIECASEGEYDTAGLGMWSFEPPQKQEMQGAVITFSTKKRKRASGRELADVDAEQERTRRNQLAWLARIPLVNDRFSLRAPASERTTASSPPRRTIGLRSTSRAPSAVPFSFGGSGSAPTNNRDQAGPPDTPSSLPPRNTVLDMPDSYIPASRRGSSSSTLITVPRPAPPKRAASSSSSAAPSRRPPAARRASSSSSSTNRPTLSGRDTSPSSFSARSLSTTKHARRQSARSSRASSAVPMLPLPHPLSLGAGTEARPSVYVESPPATPTTFEMALLSATSAGASSASASSHSSASPAPASVEQGQGQVSASASASAYKPRSGARRGGTSRSNSATSNETSAEDGTETGGDEDPDEMEDDEEYRPNKRHAARAQSGAGHGPSDRKRVKGIAGGAGGAAAGSSASRPSSRAGRVDAEGNTPTFLMQLSVSDASATGEGGFESDAASAVSAVSAGSAAPPSTTAKRGRGRPRKQQPSATPAPSSVKVTDTASAAAAARNVGLEPVTLTRSGSSTTITLKPRSSSSSASSSASAAAASREMLPLKLTQPSTSSSAFSTSDDMSAPTAPRALFHTHSTTTTTTTAPTNGTGDVRGYKALPSPLTLTLPARRGSMEVHNSVPRIHSPLNQSFFGPAVLNGLVDRQEQALVQAPMLFDR